MNTCALGQVSNSKNKSTFIKHEVSGIVQDSLKSPIAGTLIILISDNDSVRAVTNDDGVFIFKEINSAAFQLKLSHIGYTAVIKKFYFNNVNSKLILDPIILGASSNELNEVIVNGRPSIIYKTDTVEYKASDYKTTKNARLDELLRQMQGVEVGSDGSMQYLGQPIKKARLNGKDYAGGDVAQVIQNLPADIADKVQFIDDYGAQATRTGIKNGDPSKIVNITTKKDKSVGSIAQVSAGEGTNDRYNYRLFAQHLNGNQQIGLIGNTTNTINGVSGYSNDNSNNSRSNTSSGSLSSNAGNGGISTVTTSAFTYRDQLTNNLQLNLNYLYNRKNLNSVSQSEADQFGTLSPLTTTTQSAITNISNDQTLNIEIEYTPDTKNYFLLTSVFNYDKTDNISKNYINESGLINQLDNSVPNDFYSMPLGTATLYWQHIFNKRGRNLSVQASYLQSEQTFQNSQYDKISYLSGTRELLRDTTVQLYVFKKSKNRTFSTDLQFVEPLAKNTNIQIGLQLILKNFGNIFETKSGANFAYPYIDSLTGNFNYSFLQNRVSSSYQLVGNTINLSAGLALLTATLNGPHTNSVGLSNNTSFYLVPILRFQYKWSAEESASFYYISSIREPSFDQLQPVPDYSSIINPVFGNPDLKPALLHRITANYFNYLPNQRVNIALNVNATIVKNQIVPDMIQVYLPQQTSYLNQTYFRNINGNYTINTNFTVSKQVIHDLNLEYNTNIDYGHFDALNNNNLSIITNWHIFQRLGPKIVPDEHIQIYPFLAYNIFKINNNQTVSDFDVLKTTSLNLQANFNMIHSWYVNISASKNYTSGLNTDYKNPFLLNFYIEKEISSFYNAHLRLQAFDLLNQNNYINRVITTISITDVSSNALKRYVMLSLIMNFQKWGGAVSKKGKELTRRGDGSFIYP